MLGLRCSLGLNVITKLTRVKQSYYRHPKILTISMKMSFNWTSVLNPAANGLLFTTINNLVVRNRLEESGLWDKIPDAGDSPTHNKLATCERNHVTGFIGFFIERGAVYGQGQNCIVSLDPCKTAAMMLVWYTHISLNENDAEALSQLFLLHISFSQTFTPGRTLKHLVQYSGLRNWGRWCWRDVTFE